MFIRKTLFTIVILLVVVATVFAVATPLSAAPGLTGAAAEPTPAVAGNLLANPGFEDPYHKQCCHTEPNFYPNSPYEEVQVAHGWSGWWREPDLDPGPTSRYPVTCDYQGVPGNCTVYHRPEWRGAAPFANRIHSGVQAQKYFTFFSTHEAGMYQKVTTVRPGQKLQFTIYLQAWSTHVSETSYSSGQQTMNLKVGIDPYGGTDAFSSNIVWSAPGDSYDQWTQFSVTATAQSTAATVFIYSHPVYGLQHNDVYLDDAALVVVGSGAVTGAGVKPTTGSSAAPTGPYPGTTLDANGNIIYVIQTGDTAWSLSRRFNITLQQLATWNADRFPNISILRIGKTIIVGKIKK
jgi:LysM repeat protein